MPNQESIDAVASRLWFYEFDLPDGRQTTSWSPPGVAQIYTTRLELLMAALEPVVGGDWAGNSVIDVACHQGYFASHLARKGCPMVASFGIIDETGGTHAPEASTTGICITPSYDALLFLMRKLGLPALSGLRFLPTAMNN